MTRGRCRDPELARLLTQVHGLLKEAIEHLDANPLQDVGQPGVVRQHCVKRGAEAPTMRQVQEAVAMRWRSERLPSKHITRRDLKKTTELVLGRPSSA
jgi:hypothetical protein